MTQLKEERERAIPLGPYTATEVLIWRRRVSLLHRKLKELESQIKAERGDVTPPDESASVKSLKKKLKDLQESEDLLEEALSEAEGGSQQEKELLFLREQLPKALEAISEDLRMILDEDLGLLLEELDNLKSKYRETQKAAGEEPSAEQEAEMKDTRDKIKKINEQIKKLILGMRRLDLKVDLNTVVAIERD
ncbi:chaperone related protein [Cystoisospora suis]|uniref:Chaperone related protein n=1 Tax=Cystoisospora suis TaxID=483139 RepID=A0A2C6KGF9_9APIC|nr:chaperone related protein [Cystoisospora suis]